MSQSMERDESEYGDSVGCY